MRLRHLLIADVGCYPPITPIFTPLDSQFVRLPSVMLYLMENRRPVSLLGLSRHLSLPERWLKAQAANGKIPCLRIGRRLLFDPTAVEEALLGMAAHPPASDDSDE